MNARLSDPITSHRGATDVAPRKLSQRERLLAAFIAHPDGLTDEEAAVIAGLPPRSCWWKRCSDLRDFGLIVDTGRTRLGSLGSERMVCRAVEGAVYAPTATHKPLGSRVRLLEAVATAAAEYVRTSDWPSLVALEAAVAALENT